MRFEKPFTALGGHFDLDSLNENIELNEHKMIQPDFWNDQVKAKRLIAKTNQMKSKYNRFKRLTSKTQDLEVALELLADEPDPKLAHNFTKNLAQVQSNLKRYQLDMLLNGKYDANNAILEIHPGAGGTEAHDWGSMLFRMYVRWGEQHGFQIKTLNYQAGEVAGIDTVTIMIVGKNAYGYLRSEKGIHRLVRISPFDSANRRHTSFASVDVMPELDDTVHVNINPADLRVDVFRASGAGGQHVNKTESAVRITHEPTGIVVSSQEQRSQLQNRQTAMKMLKSKLYELQERKKREKREKIEGVQKAIGWGSQIRSYVFQPYTMVKDHRTNYSTPEIQKVMDGGLDPFINAYLRWQLSQKNPN